MLKTGRRDSKFIRYAMVAWNGFRRKLGETPFVPTLREARILLHGAFCGGDSCIKVQGKVILGDG